MNLLYFNFSKFFNTRKYTINIRVDTLDKIINIQINNDKIIILYIRYSIDNGIEEKLSIKFTRNIDSK